MRDNNTNVILKEVVEKLRGTGNINFALYPKCSNNTSNIEYANSLNNPCNSIVHEIECRNCNNKHHTCEKHSWKRKEIFDCSRKLKRHQKDVVHAQAENEASEFIRMLCDPKIVLNMKMNYWKTLWRQCLFLIYH